MSTQFEGVMELFDLKVRRLSNGNKLSLVFESAEDIEAEKQLIEFRGCNVEAIIQHELEADQVIIQKDFEVFNLKCRRLRNITKLHLVIERMYDREIELNAVKLRFQNCKIFFKKIEQELPLEDEIEA